MLYYLLYHTLQRYFSPLNVFRYITVRTVYASLTAMFLALVFGPWLIQRLRSADRSFDRRSSSALGGPKESFHFAVAVRTRRFCCHWVY